MQERVMPSWRDAVLPCGLLALGTFELWMLGTRGWGYGVALEALASASLLLRRYQPLVFATAAPLVVLLMPWLGPQLNDAAVPIMYCVVAIYSLARWINDLWGLAGLALILVTFATDYRTVDNRVHNWTDVMFILALSTPPYVLGRIVRKLATQGEQLRGQQALVRREAVRDERERIARELHDVIAHSVSAMVVQTAAAQDLVRTDPDRAELVLADVAATGRRTLVETGRLLHVIRDEGDELGLDPQPGLADLPSLVAGFRDRGLDVELAVDGTLPRLSAGSDVSAYRIVQEALTNAGKHGADRTACLRLSLVPAGLQITSSNPVNGTKGDGSGLGLLGMAERVTLLGGQITHGVSDAGRFDLSVTLPVDARVDR